jgi:hypothetical protein|tara:strand:+ start:412 stop:744 length:333 start_codon:yes stop_codon:yes gene_type:complete
MAKDKKHDKLKVTVSKDKKISFRYVPESVSKKTIDRFKSDVIAEVLAQPLAAVEHGGVTYLVDEAADLRMIKRAAAKQRASGVPSASTLALRAAKASVSKGKGKASNGSC